MEREIKINEKCLGIGFVTLKIDVVHYLLNFYVVGLRNETQQTTNSFVSYAPIKT